jgi:hypothetical protein
MGVSIRLHESRRAVRYGGANERTASRICGHGPTWPRSGGGVQVKLAGQNVFLGSGPRLERALWVRKLSLRTFPVGRP